MNLEQKIQYPDEMSHIVFQLTNKRTALQRILDKYRHYGQISIYERANHFSIGMIHFDKLYQRQGLLTELIKEVAELAEKKGKDIKLKVCGFEVDEKVLEQIYEKLGFEKKEKGKMVLTIKK